MTTLFKEKFPIGLFKLLSGFTYQVFNNFIQPILIAGFVFCSPLLPFLGFSTVATTTQLISSDAQVRSVMPNWNLYFLKSVFDFFPLLPRINWHIRLLERYVRKERIRCEFRYYSKQSSCGQFNVYAKSSCLTWIMKHRFQVISSWDVFLVGELRPRLHYAG